MIQLESKLTSNCFLILCQISILIFLIGAKWFIHNTQNENWDDHFTHLIRPLSHHYYWIFPCTSTCYNFVKYIKTETKRKFNQL